MFRSKLFFVVLLLALRASLVPLCSSAQTTSTPVIVAAGSPEMWQAMALAAMNYNPSTRLGDCTAASVTAYRPCFHYTSNAAFSLNDSRPTFVGGATTQDLGNLWVVWDSPTGNQKRHVWIYINVESTVGVRCFFASPRCNMTAPTGYTWGPGGGLISSALWGSDIVPPSDVQNLLTSGVPVNTAATDIRPEDALFAECRVNSALGNGNPGFGDGLDGLGYNSNNPSGTCPAFGATLAQLVGNPIQSGTSGNAANVLAYNISGHDPFTDQSINATGISIDVGADPIVFVFSRSSTANTGLAGATNAIDSELQTVFSGDDCDAMELGLASAPISVYLRDPLSGAMNTTEASVFRRPVETTPSKTVLGESQEKGVNATLLSNTPCSAGGARTRGIGTSEVVADVQDSGGAGNDGVAYTFFSFANVSAIAGSANYGYLTLDGQDPLGIGTVNQQLPTCTAPCPESQFWPPQNKTLNSFPGLRAGNYSAWSMLRMITTNAEKNNLTDLVDASQKYVVNDTPDYIPAVATSDTQGNTDPGVLIWHTHYQQRDGNDKKIGRAPNNGTFVSGNPTFGDTGGDMGGCTISTTGITATTQNNYIQTGPGTTCSSSPLRN